GGEWAVVTPAELDPADVHRADAVGAGSLQSDMRRRPARSSPVQPAGQDREHHRQRNDVDHEPELTSSLARRRSADCWNCGTPSACSVSSHAADSRQSLTRRYGTVIATTYRLHNVLLPSPTRSIADE